jgi:hypothetical protein
VTSCWRSARTPSAATPANGVRPPPAEEEIGLTGVTFVQGPKLREDTPRRLFCQFYSAVVDWPLSSFTIESEEVEQIKWMPKEEFLQDVRKHPEAYVASMSVIVQIFYSDEARG